MTLKPATPVSRRWRVVASCGGVCFGHVCEPEAVRVTSVGTGRQRASDPYSIPWSLVEALFTLVGGDLGGGL